MNNSQTHDRRPAYQRVILDSRIVDNRRDWRIRWNAHVSEQTRAQYIAQSSEAREYEREAMATSQAEFSF